MAGETPRLAWPADGNQKVLLHLPAGKASRERGSGRGAKADHLITQGPLAPLLQKNPCEGGARLKELSTNATVRIPGGGE